MKPKNRTETLWYTWSVLSLLMLICLWGGHPVKRDILFLPTCLAFLDFWILLRLIGLSLHITFWLVCQK